MTAELDAIRATMAAEFNRLDAALARLSPSPLAGEGARRADEGSAPPPRDPAFFSYHDLAALFGLSADVVRRRMPDWEKDGFPAPFPWSQRDKRWDPASVRRWKARREVRAQAVKPELRLVGGNG